MLVRNLISNVKWNPDYSGRSGEGADPCPPLLLDQTEATRAENIFWENAPPPLSQGLDDRTPPLSEGLDPPLD